jgi:hypothetical protein
MTLPRLFFSTSGDQGRKGEIAGRELIPAAGAARHASKSLAA